MSAPAAVQVEIVTSAGPLAARQWAMMSIRENLPLFRPKISQPCVIWPIASDAIAAAKFLRTVRPVVVSLLKTDMPNYTAQTLENKDKSRYFVTDASQYFSARFGNSYHLYLALLLPENGRCQHIHTAPAGIHFGSRDVPAR